MKIIIHFPHLVIAFCLGVSACSVAKLEARLEADPQCKPLINPKSGALMPCPGTDKAFYATVQGQVKTDSDKSTLQPTIAEITSNKITMKTGAITDPITKQAVDTSAGADCKPKIHQKTGGLMPCPSE